MDKKYLEVNSEYKVVAGDLSKTEENYAGMIEQTPRLVHVLKNTRLTREVIKKLGLEIPEGESASEAESARRSRRS